MRLTNHGWRISLVNHPLCSRARSSTPAPLRDGAAQPEGERERGRERSTRARFSDLRLGDYTYCRRLELASLASMRSLLSILIEPADVIVIGAHLPYLPPRKGAQNERHLPTYPPRVDSVLATVGGINPKPWQMKRATGPSWAGIVRPWRQSVNSVLTLLQTEPITPLRDP